MPLMVYFRIPMLITIVSLIIIPGGAILTTTNNHFGITNFAYGQTNQTNSDNANSLNIQNIPVKKVHVGDIDIAYKTFGKGEPFLLIGGVGDKMDSWEPSILRNLSTNTVIVFDNRGVGNTTTGTKPF